MYDPGNAINQSGVIRFFFFLARILGKLSFAIESDTLQMLLHIAS